jgi:predicted RNase H-like HicB family nuclease
MNPIGFTYWQDEEIWVGYLDEYPDYMTQGICFEDLKEHLTDLYKELSAGENPHARLHAELELV